MIHQALARPSLPAVVWPTRFQPAEADAFVSNEVIAKGLTPGQVWTALVRASRWKATVQDKDSTLQKGDVFELDILGNGNLFSCTVTHAALDRTDGRIGWTGKSSGSTLNQELHASWVVHQIHGATRILFQQSWLGYTPQAAERHELLLRNEMLIESVIDLADTIKSENKGR